MISFPLPFPIAVRVLMKAMVQHHRDAELRAAIVADDTPLHKAADAHYKKTFVAVQYAFARGRAAVRAGNLAGAAKAASRAVRAALLEVLPKTLLKVVVAGGEAGMFALPRMKAAGGPGSGNFGHGGRPGEVGGSSWIRVHSRFEDGKWRELAEGSIVYAGILVDLKTGDLKPLGSRLRIAAPKLTMSFDAGNPLAAQWAREHAAELAKDLSETTEQAIRDAIAAAEEGDLTQKDAYNAVLEAVGDENRAQLIARTEIMAAANEGQRQAWDQAVDSGLLPPDARRVWITAGDPCPECETLEDEEADLDGQYPGDGGDGPPLHPNCRCTEGIVG